jgi:hypothetical protein
MADGLLRTVAQLCFGEQTENTVRLAEGWLRRRSHWTTGLAFESLAARVHPRVLVDKSPSTVYDLASLRRLHGFFPQARFIHLLRHPRGHGESVLKYVDYCARQGYVPHWLLRLSSFPSPLVSHHEMAPVDPQRAWHTLHMTIHEFLAEVPPENQLRVRGEDVLSQPELTLRWIADWLGWPTDDESIQQMMHPEHSPYACYGPPGALLGNDHFFLQQPVFRQREDHPQSLDDPLSWLTDGQGFWPEVRDLARQFGYH